MRRLPLLLWLLFFFLLLCSHPTVDAAVFDGLPRRAGAAPLPDGALQALIEQSIAWLEFRAEYSTYPQLKDLADALQSFLRPCPHCIDYFEALGLLRRLGRAVKRVIDDGKNDVHYPVVRRAYIAAVWLLQRSRMFKWELTHLQANALSIMYRLYVQHVSRAKGRPISFHHISKCGGTTMCQLAAANKCSNPHMNIEKNCVLSDKLDSPIWMIGHDVTPDGAVLNASIGAVDVTVPPNATLLRLARYDREPRLPMWLMYACPYSPRGQPYTCAARAEQVAESGTKFLANERTLSTEFELAQVCPEFLNAVILREPVPHAISLLAEVQYRYVRQLVLRRNITAWAPPAWNLTWWETLGPALVGGYATRTLAGRAAFCRSASNMTARESSDAADALLSFDVVMTLHRPADIDLLVSSMLGWPAQNFSAQPASRVRDIAAQLAGGANGGAQAGGPSMLGSLHGFGGLGGALSQAESGGGGDGDDSSDDGDDDLQRRRRRRRLLASAVPAAAHASSSSSSSRLLLAAARWARRALLLEAAADKGQQQQQQQQRQQSAGGSDDGDAALSDDLFDAAAADAAAVAFHEPPPPPPVPASVLAAAGAVELVRSSWWERAAARAGLRNVSDAQRGMPAPRVEHLNETTAHGAHLVAVTPPPGARGGGGGGREVWHAFPRHGFAFVAADVSRLEALTSPDARLLALGELLLDLDTAWLGALQQAHHYRKRLRSLATTYAACGFAGMMPVEPEQPPL